MISIEVGKTYLVSVGNAAEVLYVARTLVLVRMIDERTLDNEVTFPMVQAINDWKLLPNEWDSSQIPHIKKKKTKP